MSAATLLNAALVATPLLVAAAAALRRRVQGQRATDEGPGAVIRAFITLIGGSSVATIGAAGLRGGAIDAPDLTATVIGSAIGGLSAVVMILSESRPERLGLRGASGAAWLAAITLPAVNIGLSSAWVWLLSSVGVTQTTQALMDDMRGAESPALLLGVLYATLGAPIAEELAFRGLLQGWLAERRGAVSASVGAGLMFGALHLADPVAVLPLMVFGVALGELRRRGGGIGPCLLAHAGNNALAVIVGLNA